MTLPTNETRRGRLFPPPEIRDQETRRELAKLTAGYFNAVAVAVVAIGGLAPPIAALSQAEAVIPLSGTIALSSGAFVLSLVTHLGARYILRREFRR